MRTRSGVVSHRKRLRVRKATKGMGHNRRASFRMGKQAENKALQYAYRDRRNKKREFRSLWIIRINAAARANGTTYSKLMRALQDSGITIDRKNLAQLAYEDPAGFKAVVESTTKKS